MLLHLNKYESVEIDRDGYVQSPFAVGTFGMVICTDGPRGKSAIKLPHMAAHSLFETALVPWFIVQEGVALKHFQKCGTNTSEFLARELPKQNASEAFGGGLLLVGFSPGAPPRLQAVGAYDHGQRRPIRRAQSSLSQIVKTGAFQTEQNSNYFEWYEAKPTRSLNSAREVFYGCLPYLRYEWGPSSLSDAISCGAIAKWGFGHYITFFSRLLSALAVLHKSGRAHGDLRIDHILSRGDNSDPASYFVTEYASLHSSVIGNAWPLPVGVFALPTSVACAGTLPENHTGTYARPITYCGRIRCSVGYRSALAWTINVRGWLGPPVQLKPGTYVMFGSVLLQVKDSVRVTSNFQVECAPYWYSRVGRRLVVLAEAESIISAIEKSTDLTIFEPASESEDVFRVGVIAAQLVSGLRANDGGLLQIIVALAKSGELLSRFPVRIWRNGLGTATEHATENTPEVANWYRALVCETGLSEQLAQRLTRHAWMVGLVWFAGYCMHFRDAVTPDKFQNGLPQFDRIDRTSVAKASQVLDDLL